MRKKISKCTKKSKAKKTQVARNPEASVDELLAAADAAITALDVEKAIKLYSKAAGLLRMGRMSSTGTREQDLIQVLEKMGESKVSVGDQDGAKQDFQEALQLLDQEKDQNVAYYEARSSLLFYVGQLCMADEALEAYRQGVTSLESCLAFLSNNSVDHMEEDNNINQKLIPELRRKLSGAYCTMAELYLTDLCYETNAETECEVYLEKALQIKDTDGEPVVDALQTMASLRLSQESRRVEAVPFILRAYDKMRVGSEALAALVGLGEQETDPESSEEQALELKEVDAANNLPEFEFRCQTAKLLLECASVLKASQQASELTKNDAELCLSASISVLGSLLAQNDEVVEIWFLTGCAFSAKNPPVIDSAIFYFQRSMEMLTNIKNALKQEAEYATEVEKEDIEDQLQENQIQIEDVRAKLDELDNFSPKMEE